MTDDDWLTSNDPWNMLHSVQRLGPSERKVRLFNASVCRRYWDYLPEASQSILSESELLADGLAPVPSDDMELCGRANAVVAPFDRQYPKKDFPSEEVRIQRDAAAAVCYAVIPNELWGAVSYFWEIDPTEKEAHVVLIRDIFSTPNRSVTADQSWLTLTVLESAKAIYENRAFDRLPVLADSLDEAGCQDAEILDHCRQPGPHVRGCWVVDLLLGKE